MNERYELLDGRVSLIHTDARHIPLEDGSVDCCVTSPPYWGLRDYGTANWESSDLACDHRPPDEAGGTKKPTTGQREHAGRFSGLNCWKCGARRIDDQLGLEKIPEEYIQNLVQVFREVRRVLKDEGTLWLNLGDSYAANRSYQVPSTKGGLKHSPAQGFDNSGMSVPDGLKPKDLVGIPWSVAFALRSDGWYLRSDIVWNKPNCMPESVKDRPTRSHEYIFLLSKSPKYYYDREAIQEPAVSTELKKFTDNGQDKQWGHGRRHAGFNGRYAERLALEGVPKFRNKRDVWDIPTSPFRGAHFAVFPPKLIEPCVLAGCPENGLVLDPFGGSGTTGKVAIESGRRAVLLDLNYTEAPGSYLEIAKERILAPAKPNKVVEIPELPSMSLFNQLEMMSA